MIRRAFHALALMGVSLALAATPLSACAQERIGVLMLHGKNPGSNMDPNFSPMKGVFEKQSWLAVYPDMPWSRFRYLDGHLDQAMAEIAGHVKGLREKGATKIVVAGHSIGVPMAMAYAARGGDVDALVQLAPGHIPYAYYTQPNLKPVRDSVDAARELVKAGKGDSKERFTDINQGRQITVVTTAKDFLSYFDPTSDADMSVSAPRIPARVPVMVAIGEKDPFFKSAKTYYFNRLPENPKNKYLEVPGGHLDTPKEASDEVVGWIKAVLAP
jgi:pimeloyl-ACP methyl ester carboxylesterase